MITQEDFDRGTTEIAPSRYLATKAFWAQVSDCDFDHESFVPTDRAQHDVAHKIKGDSEFATDDKHGPIRGPLIDHLMKNSEQGPRANPRSRTPWVGDVWLARRVIIPSRNLTVWVYPPEAEQSLREYHATGIVI